MCSRDNIDLGGTARSPEDVKRLNDLGLEFAEISIPDPEIFSDQVKVYQNLKDKTGLYYLCHGPREGDPNNTENLNRKYLPKIYHILSLISSLEIPLLTLHLWLDPRFVTQKAIRFKTELLQRITERANKYGITACIENLSEIPSHMAGPFEFLPLLNLTLDLGHAQLFTNQNLSYEFLDKYPERIRHIHLHDNRGGESYLDDIHLPPGKGIIDFNGIFKCLGRIGYNRTVTLELKTHEIESCLDYTRDLLTQTND